MALTANEVNQLKTAGYNDAQIAVMTEREARQKITALNGTVDGSTAGGSGLPGKGTSSWLGDMFGMIGDLGTAGFGFGSTYVASKNGQQPGTTGGAATTSGTGFVPQILAPENRSNLVWIILGGAAAIGLGIALYFGFRNRTS